MKPTSLRAIALPALAAGVLMASSSAHAIFRAYLSGSGFDTNPCTLVAPCRLLPAALAAVDPGGEIWMMDSANFSSGPTAITKSVTILAIPGQLGSVVGIGGDALLIATAGVEVTLQNLNIRWLSGTGHGINVTNGAKVTIVNCNIFNFAGTDQAGIRVNTGTNATKVNVINSVVRNNYNGLSASGNSRTTISKSHFVAHGLAGILNYNLTAATTTSVHVSESVSSGNGFGFVVVANATSGIVGNTYVTRSVATDNTNYGFMIQDGPNGTLVAASSQATNNGIAGFANLSTGTFLSRLDNVVMGNGTNVSGSVTTLPGV